MKVKKGIALVMANAEYVQQNKLLACKKDGEDVKEALEYLNFDVIFGMDLNRADMYDIIDEYVGTAEVEIKEGSEAGDFKLETVTFMKVCRRDRLKYMKKYAEMLEKYYKAGQNNTNRELNYALNDKNGVLI